MVVGLVLPPDRFMLLVRKELAAKRSGLEMKFF